MPACIVVEFLLERVFFTPCIAGWWTTIWPALRIGSNLANHLIIIDLDSNDEEFDSKIQIRMEKPVEIVKTVKKPDPRMLTKIFECPLCLAKFGFLKDIQNHIEEFHGLNAENQSRLGSFGLKIKEISL